MNKIELVHIKDYEHQDTDLDREFIKRKEYTDEILHRIKDFENELDLQERQQIEVTKKELIKLINKRKN